MDNSSQPSIHRWLMKKTSDPEYQAGEARRLERMDARIKESRIRREIEAREAERGVFKDAPELVEDIVATLKQVRKYGIPGNCSVVRTVVLHKMEVHGVRHLLHNGFKCSLSFCRRFVANRLAGIVLRQQKAQSLPLDYEELGRMMMSILNWDGLPVDAQ